MVYLLIQSSNTTKSTTGTEPYHRLNSTAFVHCSAFNQLISEQGGKRSVAHCKGDVILLEQFGPGNQSTVSLG